MIINPQNVSVTAVASLKQDDLKVLLQDSGISDKLVFLGVTALPGGRISDFHEEIVVIPNSFLSYTVGWVGEWEQRPDAFRY